MRYKIMKNFKTKTLTTVIAATSLLLAANVFAANQMRVILDQSAYQTASDAAAAENAWVIFFNNDCLDAPSHISGSPLNFADVVGMTSYTEDIWCDTASSLPAAGLKRLESSLNFVGSDLINVAGLSELTFVGGHLNLIDTSLTSIEGLSALTEIGGSLKINWNHDLTTLKGLENLTSVSGDLAGDVGGFGIVMHDMFSLDDVSALGNLTSVNGGIAMDGFVNFGIKASEESPFCQSSIVVVDWDFGNPIDKNNYCEGSW
jgi:hypothetical protein